MKAYVPAGLTPTSLEEVSPLPAPLSTLGDG